MPDYQYIEQGEKLRQFREGMGKKPAEFADALGVGYSSYKDYENGKNNLTATILRKLRQHFNLNVNWLLTGEGQMVLDTGEKLFQDLATSPIKLEAAIEYISEVLADMNKEKMSADDIVDGIDQRFKKRLAAIKSSIK